MSAPFFSICTPVYNGELFIAQMLETMFLQTFPDWELIIVNDGSTDRTWEIVREMAENHPQVRLLENPRNIGQRESLNRLLREARGTWVGVLPADDGYRAHTLKTIHDYVRNREDLVLWCHTRLAVGGECPPDVIVLEKYVTEWPAEKLAERLFLRGNIFGGMANYFFRRSAAEEAGLTFLGGDGRVDVSFWIRLLMSHPGKRAVYHPDVLSYVTMHPASLSVSCGVSGEHIVTYFDLPRELALLAWSRQARLLQIARLLKGWLRFGRGLPPGESGLPLRAILTYVKSLIHPGDPAA